MATHVNGRAPRLRLAKKKALVALALTAIVFRAQALGGIILIDAPPAQDYTLAIGPGVAGYPETPGSNRTRVVPVPGLDFYSSLGGFASTDIGLGWNFSRRADVQFGVRLWPVFGRDDDRSRQRGLSDVGTRLGKGLFLNYAPWEFLILQSSVLAGSGYHGDGVQMEGGATLGARIGTATLLGFTLGGTWANRAHVQSYYGVTPEESAAGGLPAYAPGAGWSDVNVQLNGEMKINERWKLSGQLLGARLLGDESRSPVTESRHQGTFSLTLWYQLK